MTGAVTRCYGSIKQGCEDIGRLSAMLNICPQNSGLSKHWTSLFTPDTVGLMIHALLAFVSILASAFRRRQGVALENLALRPIVRCMCSSRWRTTGVAYCASTRRSICKVAQIGGAEGALR